ncbi:MAG: hypothetical protein ACYCT1_02085 [Steroidobacteraceae bacterium]
MSIDNVQARCEDGCIEVGLFEGEECREVIALRAPEAFELRDSLNDALREAGLLDRKTAASEQHAVELLEVARDVVCARIETVDPVRFYERMNAVSERAKKAVETVDHAPRRRLPPAEREALAARPWLDAPEPGHAEKEPVPTDSTLEKTTRDLVASLRATIPALVLLGDYIGNEHKGKAGIPAFDRCAIIGQAKGAIAHAEQMLSDPQGRIDSAAEAAARRLTVALESVGFGCDDVQINGCAAVNVINDHLPALRAALGSDVGIQPAQPHGPTSLGDAPGERDAYLAGDEEDLGR